MSIRKLKHVLHIRRKPNGMCEISHRYDGNDDVQYILTCGGSKINVYNAIARYVIPLIPIRNTKSHVVHHLTGITVDRAIDDMDFSLLDIHNLTNIWSEK